MKKSELKKILLNYYSEPGTFAILNGNRKPKLSVVCELYNKHDIPHSAWLDIGSFISENDIKRGGRSATTKEI